MFSAFITMNNEIILLLITASSIGFFHTLLGPDHYLPFIVLSKSRNWSLTKTVLITITCGLGHVASSILLGAIGIGFGVAVSQLELIESVRGDWAAWAFIILGLGYLIWALWRLSQNKHAKHLHVHGHLMHSHEHDEAHLQNGEHTHEKDKKVKLTPWLLFLAFVLGPCEPLIPLLMYPAAKASIMGVIAVTSVFTIVTLSTMLAIVLAANYGISFIKMEKLEKYTHSIAGATITLSGVLILLGL
jgi:sulfite exporter TauE/SafE